MAFTRPDRDIDRVFLHCSASDNPDHDDISVIRRWHVDDNGWSDVGYHYFIRKDGTCEAGRDLERTPAAQAGNNTGTIAICLHGLLIDRFTAAQFAALLALCQAINTAFGGQVTFHGHTEVSDKDCPVFDYRAVLGLDDEGSMSHPPGEPASSVAKRTLRVTHRGEAVELLQRLLIEQGHEIGSDGIFGQQTLSAVRAFQQANGLATDGVVGPATWRALTV